MNPEDLITCCGFYGGTCARFVEYTVFRDLAAILAEIVDAHGFHYWMPESVKEFDYTEFRKTLDFFSKKNTWLVCERCCKDKGCRIAECCENHGLTICFDCNEFPCDKINGLQHVAKQVRDNYEEYKKLGKEKWLQHQITKAKQGYELHTEKYYQIWAKKYPPRLTILSKILG